jgi:DNA-binding GntR family transcriptional regulator
MSDEEGSGGGRARRQLSDEVAGYVRELILTRQLGPGEFIRQERIAEELQLSATPVREGLLELKGEGFVQLKTRRGFVVAQLTSADIRDLFAAQAWLAGELVARAAAHIDADEVAALDRVHKAQRKASASGDTDEVERLNHEFHRRINLVADAPRLAWMLSISTRFAPRRLLASDSAWAKASGAHHRDIVKALSAGDAERARATMVEHMRKAGELVATNFDSADA